MTAPSDASSADLPGGATLQRMAGADRYNAWLFQRSRPYLGERVLDAGAGIGTFTELVAAGRQVVALEPDPEAATELRRRFAQRANVTVVERDAAHLEPGELGRFDAAICFNVLEHISDDVGALKGFREHLEPGAPLLLLVPAHPWLFGSIDRTVGHERRYSKSSLEEALDQAGFATETLRHVNPVGVAGWWISSRLLRRSEVPAGPLRLYDRLVPVLKALDRVELPIGLSLWAVARA